MEQIIGLDELILSALAEDIGTGDITTLATVAETSVSEAKLIAKESGVLCGLDVFSRVYRLYDSRVRVESKLRDGDLLSEGAVIAEVAGLSRSLLTAERVALNLLQHLSGVATQTRRFADAVKAYETRIVDTRKTTPGLRVLEKYAVRVGGGSNHRFSLQDGVLIKDNHIRAAGGIAIAVAAARRIAPFTLKVEVECESLEQVREALESGADIIMLDNMSVEEMRSAVELIGGRAITEASGNIGDKRADQLAEIAAAGVDVISVGALTHSVRALDISLKF
ncbi:MAG: carboxylating nicotinate-nucleotide diphosphorylase [Oscillospiraceae bacterium]|jgi:nicotinate-nucleotide pyrophosphorylase (carboxylating)|nr:carboxylating nicotinate-nucleotide diphosphorylase [Oscillospiraceae bacterium]